MYADMNLYQEIILLKHYFSGKWVVENVKGYYEPLVTPQEHGRHYIWCNFHIRQSGKQNNENFIKENAKTMNGKYGFDLSKYKSESKTTLIRNCVEPEIGKHIF